MRIAFVHLDLGIGGAEQLITQLALEIVEVTSILSTEEKKTKKKKNDSSAEDNDDGVQVEMITTRCDPHHCFEPYKESGQLYDCLYVWGEWIPQDVFGRFRTFCSTCRLLYLAIKFIWIARIQQRRQQRKYDLIVLDVLPTPLLLFSYFMPDTATLFYCHFPDKLLKQQRQQNARQPGLFTRIYRYVMNEMEGTTMQFADTIVVNSCFTRGIVQSAFASTLSHRQLPVLYPAFDGTSLDTYRHTTTLHKGQQQQQSSATATMTMIPKEYMIVSLNRYERKKNLELILYAVDHMEKNKKASKAQDDGKTTSDDVVVALPRVIIAGGYDKRNKENVEYHQELVTITKQLGLQDIVEFQFSISDMDRSKLLHTAMVVVYTPSLEHFGIVPLEAMYAETCVLAVNNGGPKETVVDGTTGYLRDDTPEAFGDALHHMLQNHGTLAIEMGKKGRKHVIETFGQERLRREWKTLIQQTIQIGKERRRQQQSSYLYMIQSFLFEAFLIWIVILCCMIVYKQFLSSQENNEDGNTTSQEL